MATIPKPNTQGQQGDQQLPQVPASNMIAPPRVDFDRNRFDHLVAQKGVDVLVEEALQCPCKTEAIGALSTCKNCGGTGWVFANPRRSRIVLQHMGMKNTEDMWSRLVHGIVNVTYAPEENFAYMDRLTRLNANSIISEVVEFKNFDNLIYGFTTYQPKEVQYVGIYFSDDEPFIKLSKEQYQFVNTRIELQNVDFSQFNDELPITATIRYVYAPTFNIIEIEREPIDNFRWNGKGETLQELPGLAIARRTHNIDDFTKLRQGKLIDNSWDKGNCKVDNYYKPECK